MLVYVISEFQNLNNMILFLFFTYENHVLIPLLMCYNQDKDLSIAEFGRYKPMIKIINTGGIKLRFDVSENSESYL